RSSVQFNYPNGAYVVNYTDDLGRLSSMTLYDPSNNQLNYHGYTVDAAGQRTQQVLNSGNYVNYGYDNIGQLTNAAGFEPDDSPRPHEQFTYSYDRAGNLSNRVQNLLTNYFTVNSLNE